MDTQYLYLITGIIISLYLIYYILAFYWNISLKGKVILITGCDTGFGNLTAITLDKMGCIVFATCLNSSTAELLNNKTSSNTIIKIMDVTNMEQIKSVYIEISEYLNAKHLYLYGIINNAGIIEVSPFECISAITFNKIINVNLTGITNVIRTFLPLIRNNKYNKYLNTNPKCFGLFNRGRAGRIVNVTSAAGTVTAPYLTAYCASKYGAMAFSECLRYELNKLFNIWVSTVEPSFNKTALYTFGMSSGQRAKQNWQKMENSKELMEHYDLNKFIYSIEHRSDLVELVTNKDSYKVINVIIAGLQSKFPLKHYYPTWPAFIIIVLKKIIPPFLFDLAVEKAVMN